MCDAVRLGWHSPKKQPSCQVNKSRDINSAKSLPHVDTSCGDYAVPMPAGEIAGRGGVQQFSDSDTSLDQNSDYVFLQVHTYKFAKEFQLLSEN